MNSNRRSAKRVERVEPKTRLLAVCCAALSGMLSVAGHVAAAPDLKWQVDQHGGFMLVGNTLSHECSEPDLPPAIPAPVVGTICECLRTDATAPDAYYRSDDPAIGDADADHAISPSQARSTAILGLAPGAAVTHARLYWSSYASNETPDTRVHIARPSSGLDRELTPERVWTAQEHANASGRFWYQAAADVTALVRDEGAGAYRIGDFSGLTPESAGAAYGYVGWYLIVFYRDSSEPERHLTLFEGFDLVEPNGSVTTHTLQLSGLSIPRSAAGYDTKLGVAAFEGDATASGDSLSFDGTVLSDAQNPADNFFNSTRSLSGKAISTVGDLPQVTGGPRSMNGVDLDVVDITYLLKPDQTSATLTATSLHDTYLLSAFVMSVATPPDAVGTSSNTNPSTGTTDKDSCDTDADCQAPTPYCDVARTPQVCAACVTSRHCLNPALPDCSPERNVCECAAGSGKCQTDSDDDGISDDGEERIGTDPHDSDSDDDGTPDGDELNPTADTDGDGQPNANDADSDDDGLFDGTEQGFDCSSPGTNVTRQRCRADADQGVNRTNPLRADTDRGGVADGVEDANGNGRKDPDETDPTPGHGGDDYPPGRLDPGDDDIDLSGKLCSVDADCGSRRSGVICKAETCSYGCRGTGGNQCPEAQICSSRNTAAGSCSKTTQRYTDGDAGVEDEARDGIKVISGPARLYGGGGDCSTTRVASAPHGLGALTCWIGLLGWLVRRRKPRNSH